MSVLVLILLLYHIISGSYKLKRVCLFTSAVMCCGAYKQRCISSDLHKETAVMLTYNTLSV